MTSRSTSAIGKTRPYWLLIAAATLVSALLNASTTYLNTRFLRGSADWSAVAFAAILWLSFGALTPIPYLLARRYPIRREKLLASILVHVGGALVLCLAWTSAGVLLALPLNRRPPQEAFLRYYL